MSAYERTERRGRSPFTILKQSEKMNRAKLKELDAEIRALQSRAGYERRDAGSGRRLKLKLMELQQRVGDAHETERCLRSVRRKLLAAD